MPDYPAVLRNSREAAADHTPIECLAVAVHRARNNCDVANGLTHGTKVTGWPFILAALTAITAKRASERSPEALFAD